MVKIWFSCSTWVLCSDKKLVAIGCAPAVFSSLAKTRRKEEVHTVDLFFFSDLALPASETCPAISQPQGTDNRIHWFTVDLAGLFFLSNCT